MIARDTKTKQESASLIALDNKRPATSTIDESNSKKLASVRIMYLNGPFEELGLGTQDLLLPSEIQVHLNLMHL